MRALLAGEGALSPIRSELERRMLSLTRCKDLALAAAGHRVIRVSWRQLEGEQLMLVATIARVLEESPTISGRGTD